MTISNSSSTFKQPLLLVMFVCALQVIITSASLSQSKEPQPSDDDAKIDKFRKFATKQRELLSIFRTDNRDEILTLEQRDSITIRLETSLQDISFVNTIDYIKEILPDKIEPDSQDVVEVKRKQILMANVQLMESLSVLSQYLKAYLHSNPGAVKSFVKITQDKTNQRNQGRSELANFLVPFGLYMFKYDQAIDYITKLYQKECLNEEGIVEQNKWYYTKSWKKILNRINGEENKDWTMWEKFMDTACPLPDRKGGAAYSDVKRTPLDLVDFDRVVSMPKQVVPFVSYLPMIKDCTKNSDLIRKLVERFNWYKKMSQTDRTAHDGDLWTGYQKKLIVQQTIIRVMRDKLTKASKVQPGEKVPDVNLNKPSVSDKVSNKPTSKWRWFGRAVNWAAENPWWAGLIFGMNALSLIGSYIWFSGGTPDPSTPLPNNTLSPSPGVTDRRILPIDPVWLIVGVMIIVAIVLVGIGLCLICHRRNRLRKSSSDNGESDKTSKIAKSKTKKGRKDPIAKRSFVSSTRLLIGTPTSTKPSSPSPVRIRSSLYTTSAFTPSDILGTIHRPSRTNTHGSSQPVKSPMGKPNSNPSTPVSKPTKSPIPKISTGVRRALDKKGLQPTSPSTVPKGTTKPEARDPKRVHKKKK